MEYPTSSIEWLKQLVAFDTTSRNSNLELIHFIRDYLQQHNIATQLIYNDDQQKANLFATLPAAHGAINGGIILSGHTDVVPVDGQEWHTKPFQTTQIDDLIYGRGTCDMKGFIAVVLALVPEFKQIPLNYPIHFAFSYDEEVGCVGATSIITTLQQNGIKPGACLVGEPTSMRPVVAHKGINLYRCRVKGLAQHSSLTPKGCNAIEYAASLIGIIRELGTQLREEGAYDQCFDVPFTTITTNQIQGGTAVNIIPQQCEFLFEFRNLPSVAPDRIIKAIKTFINENLLPQMRQEYSAADIELETVAIAPAFETIEDNAFIKLVRDLTQDNAIHKVAYATEAGLFQQAGIPTIVCGPGSIEQAHRPNEFVAVEQINKCESFLRQLLEKYNLHN